MSVKRAQSLIAGLRWHHLGFAFFWATTFAALTNSSEELAGGYEAYSLCKQATVVITLALTAYVLRKREHYTHAHAAMAGVLLAAGSLLFYLAFFFGQYSLAAVLAAAVLVGCSSGLMFVMWQSFYASEGASRTAIYIPISAAFSVALCLVVAALPAIWSVVCSVIVLPALATLCLCRSLDEVEPYDVLPCKGGRAAMLFRDMAKPVFCVCALGFIWRLVSSLSAMEGSGSFLLLMAGMGFAVLAVTLFELFSERGFDVLAFYQVLFPVITGVFLLPTLFGQQWMFVLPGFLMFGFEVVNLLLLITCAVYASRNELNSTVVYALCVGPTLASLLLGDLAGTVLNRSSFYDFTFVVDVLFMCVYGLSIVMFLVSFGRSRRKAATAYLVPGAESGRRRAKLSERPAGLGGAAFAEGRVADAFVAGDEHDGANRFDASVSAMQDSDISDARAPERSLEARLEALSIVDPLSQREQEVTELLLHGNTVPAIARKLFISENTVRGHTKNIYRKLDIHSKQELIDLLG
ncbi:MAG: helix-turn-helix transcriptional regulator [Slackia sp.]|nr:helix-turn-helix transcriptional regulator [Slackia sp.]